MFKEIYDFKYKKIGLREESEVVGYFVFSHIRMMGYFRLGFGKKLL